MIYLLVIFNGIIGLNNACTEDQGEWVKEAR